MFYSSHGQRTFSVFTSLATAKRQGDTSALQRTSHKVWSSLFVSRWADCLCSESPARLSVDVRPDLSACCLSIDPGRRKWGKICGLRVSLTLCPSCPVGCWILSVIMGYERLRALETRPHLWPPLIYTGWYTVLSNLWSVPNSWINVFRATSATSRMLLLHVTANLFILKVNGRERKADLSVLNSSPGRLCFSLFALSHSPSNVLWLRIKLQPQFDKEESVRPVCLFSGGQL